MKKHYFLLAFLLMTFSLFAQPANDDCTSSEALAVTTNSLTVAFDINTASLNNETICSTTADFADVWYKFTMPFNGNLYVGGAIGWNNFSLYDTCGGAEIACGTSNKLFTNLTSESTYVLRVYRTAAQASKTGYQSFTIKAFETALNDDCATAETITVTTDISTVEFNIGGATINNEMGCSGTTDDYADIWYDFTMPVSGNLYVDGAIGWNNFALYDACGGIQIQCGSTNQLFTGLTSGTDYKLRLFRTTSNADNGNYLNFTFQAFEIITKDDCASAENITVTEVSSTVHFGIAGATINNEVGCHGTLAEDYADIWYEFTMPNDGSIVIDSAIGWNNFALYDACAGTEIGCFNKSGDLGELKTDTVYKLRVFRTLANSDNQGYKSFTIYSTETLSLNTLNKPIMNIYPNPSSSHITIDSSLAVEKVEFYTLLGKLVKKEESPEVMDVSKLSEGVYIMKIFTTKGFELKRMIKN